MSTRKMTISRLARCWIDVVDSCPSRAVVSIERDGYVRYLCQFHYHGWALDVRKLTARLPLGADTRLLKEEYPELWADVIAYLRRWSLPEEAILEGLRGDVAVLAL